MFVEDLAVDVALINDGLTLGPYRWLCDDPSELNRHWFVSRIRTHQSREKHPCGVASFSVSPC